MTEYKPYARFENVSCHLTTDGAAIQLCCKKDKQEVSNVLLNFFSVYLL